MKKNILSLIVVLLMSFSLNACIQTKGLSLAQSASPIKIEPYLIDGSNTWQMAGTGGVQSGKYLQFKLTNTSSEDYIVSFTLITKGKTQDGGNGESRDFVYEIPNILVPAYAKTENVFNVMKYNRKGYFTTNETQFFGRNADGSCLAETVKMKNVVIGKASANPEKIKPYKYSDGKLAYDTQGAFPFEGSYSQKVLN